MLQGLTNRLFDGKISLDQYVSEYDELVAFAGWTWDNLSNEVDARWTNQARQVPQCVFIC
jgi:hypothetical protein